VPVASVITHAPLAPIPALSIFTLIGSSIPSSIQIVKGSAVEIVAAVTSILSTAIELDKKEHGVLATTVLTSSPKTKSIFGSSELTYQIKQIPGPALSKSNGEPG